MQQNNLTSGECRIGGCWGGASPCGRHPFSQAESGSRLEISGIEPALEHARRA